MNLLPIALIIIGYVTLIVMTGWWGVAIAVVHIGTMVLAARFSGTKSSSSSRSGAPEILE